jgi:hypothetical protein
VVSGECSEGVVFGSGLLDCCIVEWMGYCSEEVVLGGNPVIHYFYEAELNAQGC